MTIQFIPQPRSASPGQLDYIWLLAREMTDGATACQLGLGPQTMRQYFEAAQLRYVVKRRAQFVAAAHARRPSIDLSPLAPSF